MYVAPLSGLEKRSQQEPGTFESTSVSSAARLTLWLELLGYDVALVWRFKVGTKMRNIF